jgi:hypothetical protein
VQISLGLGNQRANQKPILQVLSRAGRSLAFVKVGDSDVTRALVRAEADALCRVAALHLPGITVPRVLALRPWRGMDLLVISALRTTARRGRRSDDLPLRAMADLAAAAGLERVALAGSRYWHGLARTVDALGDRRTADGLHQVMARVERDAGSETFTFGAWHGDWAPWNMSREHSGLALWDWERFATGVPVGFDALHYRLRVALRDVGGTEPAGELLLASAGDLLAAFDVPERLAAGTTALYLLELCTRYAAAATGPAGAPLRVFADELVDFTVRRAGAP